MDHVKDFHVYDQHEQQRRQDAAEEVEVNHVLHTDDGLKLAGDDEVRADRAVLLEALQIVPP